MTDLSYIKSKVETYSSKIGTKEIIIQYRLIGETVIMENCCFEPEYIKLFINLLNSSLEDLIDKKYKVFIQKVPIEDWETVLHNNKEWEIISKDTINQTLDIKCDLDRAMKNICIGLGFT